jgi:hypothetical protein
MGGGLTSDDASAVETVCAVEGMDKIVKTRDREGGKAEGDECFANQADGRHNDEGRHKSADVIAGAWLQTKKIDLFKSGRLISGLVGVDLFLFPLSPTMLALSLSAALSALLFVYIFMPSLWIAIMSVDDYSDGDHYASVAYSQPFFILISRLSSCFPTAQPFREDAPPANMAKLILLRQKVSPRFLIVSILRDNNPCPPPDPTI